MEIINERLNDVYIFKLNGRLDSNTSPEFSKQIEQAINNESRYIILEFKNLKHISSAGLREILKTAKTLKNMAGKLVLCSMSDYIREVFEVAGFDNILSIVPAVDDALKKMKEQS